MSRLTLSSLLCVLCFRHIAATPPSPTPDHPQNMERTASGKLTPQGIDALLQQVQTECKKLDQRAHESRVSLDITLQEQAKRLRALGLENSALEQRTNALRESLQARIARDKEKSVS